MLTFLEVGTLQELVSETVPAGIRLNGVLELPQPLTEVEALTRLASIMKQNTVGRSYIGMGYSDCLTPPVIQRNILENPGWYTQYTPYQAEISQGRLEALLNFQTMIIELTGLPIANASLLDEGTAAAEAMALCLAVQGKVEGRAFLVSSRCHPQTIEVLRTRAEPLGIQVVVSDPESWNLEKERPFGILLQYPDSDGRISDPRAILSEAKRLDIRSVIAADLLSLVLLESPGALGADVAVGTTQRFGIPMGFGGPHAAYFSTRDEYKRLIPGRIVGVSQDAEGRPAIRLALQTREQHIRRDKATSNICTAQVLLAVMASMYAVYHGPDGLQAIASRVHAWASRFAQAARALGLVVVHEAFFDTVRVRLDASSERGLQQAAKEKAIHLRWWGNGEVSVSFDEAVTEKDFVELLGVFAKALHQELSTSIMGGSSLSPGSSSLPKSLLRAGPALSHPVFMQYHSETEMLRYMRRLESRDLSLVNSMIPLGSCTMKLNATAEMFPVSWPEIAKLHPFAPLETVSGYQQMLQELSAWLSEITGFPGVSLQPNAGSQGEYAGLLAIRAFHRARGEGHRQICLIPKSAHGTNPASAVMAGMQVVVVECDERGNVDLADLRAKSQEHGKNLAALMVTYPSTHGVFEEEIREICELIHAQGGQVYMDGANMNAQVGLCRPGDFGPDVCHLNLHKTFCIPHGGGGPGMGPICVASHLVPFLPGQGDVGPVSAAPWGSASILPISWMYIAMMGGEGLTRATEVAILNANYVAKRLESHYPVLYRGNRGRVAHECILDLRPLKASCGIEVEDVAKRLMDYGFHAPTVSFPVAGTLMIEPTESEGLFELDRFCDAMIAIREEIREIEEGRADRVRNVLKLAPHTSRVIAADQWDRPYTREKAAFPTSWTREWKFWPSVSRINAVQGDRNLICACLPIESYQKSV
jgi:glycine dehydrogenase